MEKGLFHILDNIKCLSLFTFFLQIPWSDTLNYRVNLLAVNKNMVLAGGGRSKKVFSHISDDNM